MTKASELITIKEEKSKQNWKKNHNKEQQKGQTVKYSSQTLIQEILKVQKFHISFQGKTFKL